MGGDNGVKRDVPQLGGITSMLPLTGEGALNSLMVIRHSRSRRIRPDTSQRFGLNTTREMR